MLCLSLIWSNSKHEASTDSVGDGHNANNRGRAWSKTTEGDKCNLLLEAHTEDHIITVSLG